MDRCLKYFSKLTVIYLALILVAPQNGYSKSAVEALTCDLAFIELFTLEEEISETKAFTQGIDKQLSANTKNFQKLFGNFSNMRKFLNEYKYNDKSVSLFLEVSDKYSSEYEKYSKKPGIKPSTLEGLKAHHQQIILKAFSHMITNGPEEVKGRFNLINLVDNFNKNSDNLFLNYDEVKFELKLIANKVFLVMKETPVYRENSGNTLEIAKLDRTTIDFIENYDFSPSIVPIDGGNSNAIEIKLAEAKKNINNCRQETAQNDPNNAMMYMGEKSSKYPSGMNLATGSGVINSSSNVNSGKAN